jgi:hypothetical protein
MGTAKRRISAGFIQYLSHSKEKFFKREGHVQQSSGTYHYIKAGRFCCA